MTEARIEYASIEELPRAKRNPKGHDEAKIRASIERFGFVLPVLLNEESGALIAGHGRLDVLQAMKEEGAAVPQRIREEGGSWLVPVIRGIDFENEQEAEAYLVADNRLVELGGWQDPELLPLLEDLEKVGMLDYTGFEKRDVDDLRHLLEKLSWEDALSGVGKGRSPFRQLTFTLSEDQEAMVMRAIQAAKAIGDAAGGPNQNENGNALALIARRYLERESDG